MTYTKKQFLEDVKKEAVALKKYATKEELGKLGFEDLNPNKRWNCIYGQMTGDCSSERACELMFKSCLRYVRVPQNIIPGKAKFTEFRKSINGTKPEGITNKDELFDERRFIIKHFSAIEIYIMQKDARNKNLIDFLKGNRKDLVL